MIFTRISIVLTLKFACGIILRLLNSHHALFGYNREYAVMFHYYL